MRLILEVGKNGNSENEKDPIYDHSFLHLLGSHAAQHGHEDMDEQRIR